tara:strand:+ start:1628 stop:2926 length:1299 start_codon:yes stop_codon:yes gene_type:complete
MAIMTGATGISIPQIKQEVRDRKTYDQTLAQQKQQMELAKQQMEAGQVALDYQKNQIAQEEKVTRAKKIGQEYTAQQYQKAISTPNLIKEDGTLDINGLVGGNFTPDKTQANYEVFAEMYKNEGLTPNATLFAQTQDTLKKMEIRAKLDTLLAYKDSQGLSNKEFNIFLRGGEQSFLGGRLTANLIQELGEDYNGFIERTGFDPEYETTFEKANPFDALGRDKAVEPGLFSPGNIVTGLGLASFLIPGGGPLRLVGMGAKAAKPLAVNLLKNVPGGKKAYLEILKTQRKLRDKASKLATKVDKTDSKDAVKKAEEVVKKKRGRPKGSGKPKEMETVALQNRPPSKDKPKKKVVATRKNKPTLQKDKEKKPKKKTEKKLTAAQIKAEANKKFNNKNKKEPKKNNAKPKGKPKTAAQIALFEAQRKKKNKNSKG